MEDHWLKASVTEVFGDDNIKEKFTKAYKEITKAVMKTPEDECGVPGA